MLQLRVSHIDLFRSWKESEEADIDWLLRDLSLDRPTEAMLRGTAFHKALEHAQSGDDRDEITIDGFTFHFQCDIDLELPAVREIRRSKDYGDVSVSGKVDALMGTSVYDHKTTSYFDSERYLSKYQWRYYLDIFEADRFTWNIFEMRDAGDIDNPRTWSVVNFHQLEQYRYPSLEEDCKRQAQEMRSFLSEYAPALVISPFE